MNGKRFRAQITEYSHRDAPVMLRLLVGIAHTTSRAVDLDYLDDTISGQTVERRETVVIVDRGADWLRFRDAGGREHTISGWDVVTAVLLDEMGEAA